MQKAPLRRRQGLTKGELIRLELISGNEMLKADFELSVVPTWVVRTLSAVGLYEALRAAHMTVRRCRQEWSRRRFLRFGSERSPAS